MTREELKELAKALAIAENKVMCMGARNRRLKETRKVDDYDAMIDEDAEHIITKDELAEANRKYQEGLQWFLHPTPAFIEVHTSDAIMMAMKRQEPK